MAGDPYFLTVVTPAIATTIAPAVAPAVAPPVLPTVFPSPSDPTTILTPLITLVTLEYLLRNTLQVKLAYKH